MVGDGGYQMNSLVRGGADLYKLCFNMEGILRTEHYEIHIKTCSTKEKSCVWERV